MDLSSSSIEVTHGTSSRCLIKIEIILYFHASYFRCNCCISKRKHSSELCINTYRCHFPRQAEQHSMCILQPRVPKRPQTLRPLQNGKGKMPSCLSPHAETERRTLHPIFQHKSSKGFCLQGACGTAPALSIPRGCFASLCRDSRSGNQIFLNILFQIFLNILFQIIEY